MQFLILQIRIQKGTGNMLNLKKPIFFSKPTLSFAPDSVTALPHD